MATSSWLVSDFHLSCRLERCEAKTNAAFVVARAQSQPSIGAAWIDCEGTYALFDGVDSPLTQTFGLGTTGVTSAGELDVIERFYRERGAEVFHEVSPLAPMSTVEALVKRACRPVEFTSVMFRPVAVEAPSVAREAETVRVRQVGESELALWASTAVEGWSEFESLSAFMSDFAPVCGSSEGTSMFLTEIDGRAIGTGALAIHDGVALLAGASTIPSQRNRGAQRALLAARLEHARLEGCDLAMICAAPGSASQRNAERQGFRIAYTRVKWGRPSVT
jgi:GNAT superfamily N-acetyltransferase